MVAVAAAAEVAVSGISGIAVELSRLQQNQPLQLHGGRTSSSNISKVQVLAVCACSCTVVLLQAAAAQQALWPARGSQATC